MERTPLKGERYDSYEPEKYHCIFVNDDHIEGLLGKLDEVDLYWHSLDVPGKGLAYCGITLIPPRSMPAFIDIIKDIRELDELKALMQKAKAENKYIIHYGL